MRALKAVRTYELWEIYKDGKHGEIFEVVDCVVPSYIGSQVKVVTADEGDYKALVHPEANELGGDASDLVTVYGCLGTAKYKKVSKYKEITITEALAKINGFRTVYAFINGDYQQVSKYTSLEALGIGDLADLLNTNFYVKEV